MADRDGTLDAIRRLYDRDRFEEASRLALEAAARTPGDARMSRLGGDLAMRAARFDDAVAAFERVVALVPSGADGWFSLGKARQWVEPRDAEDSCFRRAAALAPRRYVVPFRVPVERFEQIAGSVLTTLPPRVIDHLEATDTTVSVLPLPLAELVRDRHLIPDALGYHRSNPFHVPGGFLGGREPGAVIEIYQLTIENWSRDEAALIAQVRHTVLHEVGHAVGMDHDILSASGY